MDGSAQRRHRLVLSALVLLSGLVLAAANVAFATDLGPDGGPGGNPFRFECPKGSYIVGFQAKTGEWIDRLQPICAPWMPKSNGFGPITLGPSFGQSRGGQTDVTNCNDSGVTNRAITRLDVLFLRSVSKLVALMYGDCNSVTSPRGPLKGWTVGHSKTSYFPNSATYECPFGELVTGIHGRQGLYIDAIGITCRPFPPKPALPFETNVNPNAIAPSQAPSPLAPPSPPSNSATSQMRRSPSMIMPRGVEGKDDTEGQETVGTSPEPEKKP
ncbi:MAG TPA: hypothetical protein VFQ34_08845 [Nitrospiraceae bacterium]|jgi:hypothetical protein|nr:hypothetical protein [Nitrospiraceae bacterium]